MGWATGALGLLLLLAGLTGLAQAPETSRGAPVEARLDLQEARASGQLRIEAGEGAVLAEGAPAAWALQAGALEVTLVTVASEVVPNPLGGDVLLTASTERTTRRFAAARAELAQAGAGTLLLLLREPGAPGSLAAGLGEVDGQPFRAAREAFEVVVADAGQPYAFEHGLAAPYFGAGSEPGRAPFTARPLWVRGEGALVAVVDHAVLAVAGEGGEASYALGERTTAGDGLLPVARHERSYAILRARGAALDLDPGDAAAAMVAPEPVYRLEGALRVPAARGALAYGGQAEALQGEALALVGSFEVRPRAAPSREGLGLLGEPPGGAAGRVEGEAAEARVAGRALALPLAAPLRDASVLALALGLLATAWGALQKAFWPLALPLYARLTHRAVLDNRHRMALYALVAQRPFLHLRELERHLGVGYGAVVYHMAVLRREGAVASARVLGREMFYVPPRGASREAMRRLALLAHPTRRRVAAAVAQRPGATQADLVHALGVGQGLLSRHLARLVGAGLVASERDGRARRYRPSPLLLAWLPAPVPAANAPALHAAPPTLAAAVAAK